MDRECYWPVYLEYLKVYVWYPCNDLAGTGRCTWHTCSLLADIFAVLGCYWLICLYWTWLFLVDVLELLECYGLIYLTLLNLTGRYTCHPWMLLVAILDLNLSVTGRSTWNTLMLLAAILDLLECYWLICLECLNVTFSFKTDIPQLTLDVPE